MAEKDHRLNTECGCVLGEPHKPTCRDSIAFQASPRATAERATAGPLTIHKARYSNGLERSEDWAIVSEQIIAECFGISGYKPGSGAKEYLHQPAEAYAKLFAAAPRLLAALQEVMPRYCELFEAAGLGDSSTSVAVQIAREAMEGLT